MTYIPAAPEINSDEIDAVLMAFDETVDPDDHYADPSDRAVITFRDMRPELTAAEANRRVRLILKSNRAWRPKPRPPITPLRTPPRLHLIWERP